MSRSLVTGEDHAIAAKGGFLFVEDENGDTLRIASPRIIPVLYVLTPEDPGVVDSLIALGVKPGRQTYPIRPPSQASPTPTFAYHGMPNLEFLAEFCGFPFHRHFGQESGSQKRKFYHNRVAEIVSVSQIRRSYRLFTWQRRRGGAPMSPGGCGR